MINEHNKVSQLINYPQNLNNYDFQMIKYT